MKTEMPAIMLGKEPVTDYQQQCHAKFSNLLLNLLEEIFDPDIPFRQTTEKASCTYCPFIQLCNHT